LVEVLSQEKPEWCFLKPNYSNTSVNFFNKGSAKALYYAIYLNQRLFYVWLAMFFSPVAKFGFSAFNTL